MAEIIDRSDLRVRERRLKDNLNKRRKRLECIAAGICSRCLINPVVPNRSQCQSCLDIDAIKAIGRWRHRKNSRLCVSCGKPLSSNDNTLCSICLPKSTAASKRFYQRRVSKGICVQCGKAPITLPSKRHCERCTLEARARQSALRQKLKLETIAAYGSACECCREREPYFLEIDHINGDGKIHRKKLGNLKGGSDFYKYLKANGFPKDGLRLLCANCHAAITHLGWCPHRSAPATNGLM